MAVRFSPDGKTLASIGYDGVFLWDAGTGRRTRFWPKAFYRGCFSPDGRKLWLQTYEGAISTWDLTARPDPGPVPARFAGDHKWFLELSPDGKLLATGNKNVIRLWDIATGKLDRELKGHDHAVSHVAFSGDGKHLASLAPGDPLYWWDLDKRQVVRTFSQKDIRHFDLSPDGKTIALISGLFQSSIHLLKTDTGEEVRSIALPILDRRLRLSPDIKTLAVASQLRSPARSRRYSERAKFLSKETEGLSWLI
jgi:WD40 repeat protein